MCQVRSRSELSHSWKLHATTRAATPQRTVRAKLSIACSLSGWLTSCSSWRRRLRGWSSPGPAPISTWPCPGARLCSGGALMLEWWQRKHRKSIQGATAFCPDLAPNLNRKSAKIGSRQPGCAVASTGNSFSPGAWVAIDQLCGGCRLCKGVFGELWNLSILAGAFAQYLFIL